MGDHLVVNGDLFEFWFEYRSVIPRHLFPTLEALAALRRAGVRLTLTGGNHDRWGGPFWREQLRAEFHPDAVELELAGHRALVTHGDGVAGGELGARLLHAVTRWRPTAAAFRALHPDWGYALVRRLSPRLAGRRDPAIIEGAANAQAEWARKQLQQRRDLELLVMGHTHSPQLDQVEPGRWYLNPGAFADGGRYAVVTSGGPRLERFEG